jgi:hypothetical protein
VDAGLVVGYLVAKLLGRAARFADAKVDKLLDSLYERVWRKVGGDKALDRLARDPQNDVAQEWAKSSIQQAATADPAFEQELARLQAELQRAAPDLLVYAPGAGTGVGVNSGYLIQGPVTIHNYGDDDTDWSDAGTGVKILGVIAVLLCVAGLGLFGYTAFTHDPQFGDPNFGDPPPGIGVAAAVFFAGFVLAIVAGIANAFRRRDRRR